MYDQHRHPPEDWLRQHRKGTPYKRKVAEGISAVGFQAVVGQDSDVAGVVMIVGGCRRFKYHAEVSQHGTSTNYRRAR